MKPPLKFDLAFDKLYRDAMTEANLLRAVSRLLKAEQDVFFWKTHGSGLTMQGLPDIVGVCHGRFFGMELKTPVGRPSKMQLHVISKIKKNGGIARIVRSTKDARAMLEEIRNSALTPMV